MVSSWPRDPCGAQLSVHTYAAGLIPWATRTSTSIRTFILWNRGYFVKFIKHNNECSDGAHHPSPSINTINPQFRRNLFRPSFFLFFIFSRVWAGRGETRREEEKKKRNRSFFNSNGKIRKPKSKPQLQPPATKAIRWSAGHAPRWSHLLQRSPLYSL